MSPQQMPVEFTILLVDDKRENLLSLEELLSKGNRKFITATSGNEALKQILRNDNIGLILLDVQMPDMDGFEVAHLLKSSSKTKDIPIIFVTAINHEERYVLQGFDEGAVDYLQKPLDVDITKAKVNVFEQLYTYQLHLKNTVGELERINKQLERFVYIVAHDLKSPLSGIIGMLGILQDEEQVVNNPDILQYINMLSSAANHLSDMIGSILDYSRKSLGQQTIELVNVQELLQQIVFLLFPPKHIAIKVMDNMPVFYTKKLKLQQAFQNLISNAIKYNDKSQGIIEIGCNDCGGHYEFYVRDNGPGIAKKDQQQIFGLFQTVENKEGHDNSTGVGLNIIKMMMEEQGTRIWVESIPGEGSTFYFEWRK